ncbi:MAG: transporter substrate-binding domain-containing protein [Chloroflexi bacterium]|jgi:polar amino acid transport system substrate-binding protein|nr:transporter substrate-binding domain-containing protein [Chloroflexota bacterium]
MAKIVRKVFLWTVASMILLLILNGCRTESGAWERIEQSGLLRVGLDPTYPPFEVTEGEGVAGLDVDLAKALAGELGLSSEFVYFGYDGLYDALATEQVDVLISALVMVPGRTRDFAYSEPYFNAGEILVVPAGSDDIQGMADLDGSRLAVELGAQGHVQATQWSKRLADLAVQPYGSAEEALEAVSDAEADAALVDSISGRLFLKDRPSDQPPLMRVPRPVTVEPYAVVVRIEDEMLLEKVDGALASLAATNQLEAIINHWLGG